MSALVSYWLGLPGYLHSLVYIVAVTLVLVVFIGESVREAFDPKRYARYE